MNHYPRLIEILHLNSYYIDNHLYKKIYAQLDKYYFQKIYVPIKLNRDREYETKLENGTLYYSKIIKPAHTVFYFKKIKAIVSDIERLQIHEGVDFIHAHNLFIDGGTAYLLKKKYGVRYGISVRMTDIALQYKYMVHRRRFARRVLENAEFIIFISPLYKDLLYGYLDPAFRSALEQKSFVIPNGIDEFWFEHETPRRELPEDSPLKLLFIGQIIERKNILTLLKALPILAERGVKAELTVIGGEHPDEKQYFEKFQHMLKSSPQVTYLGKITDPNILLKHIREHSVFVMPSKRELFGLVYIEALSQNLPVIYSKNEGITPYLNHQYLGEEVDPDAPNSIAEGIVRLLKNYHSLDDMDAFSQQFNWPSIIEQYKSIYSRINI